jgi:hypothetical protein
MKNRCSVTLAVRPTKGERDARQATSQTYAGKARSFCRCRRSCDRGAGDGRVRRRYPPVVGWDGWPTTALRDTLMNADFGAATIKTKDGRFEDLLTASKPSAIPFVPTA